MEQVYIQEVNKEILVVLHTNYPTKLSALQEAVRVLQREVLRVESNLDPTRNNRRYEL